MPRCSSSAWPTSPSAAPRNAISSWRSWGEWRGSAPATWPGCSFARTAPTATRREFVAALKGGLPEALAHLQRGNIAPVDLAQAAIGPGMAVFTRFREVRDAAGKPLSVRDALALINQTLDETLADGLEALRSAAVRDVSRTNQGTSVVSLDQERAS